MIKKFIVLICYFRPSETKKTLECLRKLYKINEYELVVVRQEGDDPDCEKVKQLIDDIDWMPLHHLTTSYSNNETVRIKVNNNTFKGLNYAFENCNADLSILIEDDICLGYDALHFFEETIKKHNKDPFFKAVNAISYKCFEKGNLYDYGKFRFGLRKGVGISRKKWFSFFKRKWPYTEDIFYDSFLETGLKMGYVIMPYCARSNDIGWGEKAMNAKKKVNLFEKNKISWVGTKSFEIAPFKLNRAFVHDFRKDCKRYYWLSPVEFGFLRLIRKIKYLFGIKLDLPI